jgi:hypothetical protein
VLLPLGRQVFPVLVWLLLAQELLVLPRGQLVLPVRLVLPLARPVLLLLPLLSPLVLWTTHSLRVCPNSGRVVLRPR